MNEKELAILEFCNNYFSEHGYQPSYREIGPAVGIRSTSTVWHYIDKLKAAGYLETGYDGIRARAFTITQKGKDALL